jgi:hypothetical protein
VLGVLLLNTAMQQQADRMAAQHQRMSALTQRAQELQTRLDWESDPARLAVRARQLDLRPVTRVRFVSAQERRGTRTARRISRPRSAAGRARAG